MVEIRLVYVPTKGEGPEEKTIGRPFGVRFWPWDPATGEPTERQIFRTKNRGFARALVNALPQIRFYQEADQALALDSPEPAPAEQPAAEEPAPAEHKAKPKKKSLPAPEPAPAEQPAAEEV